MKNIILILLTSLALFACTGEKESEPEAKSTGGDYPLTTCVVSGEELGSMGDPIVKTHEGTTVKLCCEHCIPKFEADPGKYAAMVKQGE